MDYPKDGAIRGFACNTAVFIQLASTTCQTIHDSLSGHQGGGGSSVRVSETPDVRTTLRSANPLHLRRAPRDHVREGREGGGGLSRILFVHPLHFLLLGGPHWILMTVLPAVTSSSPN